MTLVCLPAHFNKHNVTLIKLGTNVAKMPTSWRYFFPRFIVFGCFGIKDAEHLFHVWCKIEINITRDHRKSYLHSWLCHSWKHWFLWSPVKYISILHQHSKNNLYVYKFTSVSVQHRLKLFDKLTTLITDYPGK